MKRKVEVVPFQSSWASAFQQEADWLKAIWREDLLAVHHIGSTSIKGMCAKPIIDIMLVVKDINRADSFNEEMMGIGYEPMGENGIEGRRFFARAGMSGRTMSMCLKKATKKLNAICCSSTI